MNTIVILVVLLVVLLILLVLVSRSGDKYVDIGEEKINASGSVTMCGIICFECCHYKQYKDCTSTSEDANPEIIACNCIDNYIDDFKC